MLSKLWAWVKSKFAAVESHAKDWFHEAWLWGTANRYRHWFFHALIAFALSFVFGAWAAFVFYLLMGIQDAVLDWAYDHVDWIHKIGDVVAPALAALIAHVFFGK